MPISNLFGAVFFRRLSFFGLTCWPADGGSTSSRDQKSSLLEMSEYFAHIRRWVTSSSDSIAVDGPSHDPSFDPECFVVGTFILLAGALPGWVITFRSYLPVPAARGLGNMAFPNRHHMRGWRPPLLHYHANMGWCLWSLSHRILSSIRSLRPLQGLCHFRNPGPLWRFGPLWGSGPIRNWGLGPGWPGWMLCAFPANLRWPGPLRNGSLLTIRNVIVTILFLPPAKVRGPERERKANISWLLLNAL